ncbi:MAG: class I SAM-dependent methyltransferase [Chloroflexota bacterium]
MRERDLTKAALRGEPSYVWRAGQERRLRMILEAAAGREQGQMLDVGCGLGAYLEHLRPLARRAFGLEFDRPRAASAARRVSGIVCGAAEHLPYPSAAFDLVLSHEVLEHVADDRQAVAEMVRVLKPGGRLVLFVPNQGYPFETHGIYWRGRYRFGNIPLVNYLPRRLRDHLAPHVRAYTGRQLRSLFADHAVQMIQRRIIFGAYDNLIARWPAPGRILRALLQCLESTPLRAFGLSHLWVVEKRPS